MLKGFRDFLLRGNVVDLAVAVVIGAAFGAIVDALVKDILTPIIAAVAGRPDFSGLKFTIHHSQFMIGDFINQLLSFVLIAGAIYFFVVIPMNKVMNRLQRRGESDEKECPECISFIPKKATKCKFCGSTQKQ